MTIWSWPYDAIPEMRSFRLRAFNISAIAAQSQELVSGGLLVQRFEARLTLPSLIEEKWRDLDGMLAELAGTGGRLRLWDHARPEPYFNRNVPRLASAWDGGALWTGGGGWLAGPLPPTVIVAETAARGKNNILLSGFPAGQSGVLRRGDLMEIWPNGQQADHGHLYEVTRWSNSNDTGLSRVYFRPGLRKGVRAGDHMLIGQGIKGGGPKPSTVFRLASDEEGNIEVRGKNFGSLGLTLIEVTVPSI